MALSDYLSVMVPDYSDTSLDVKPHEVVQGKGRFNQIVHETDGDDEKIVTLSTTPRFYVTLKWVHLSAVDFGSLFNFYFDAAKALGVSRSFIWVHPTEGTGYVVRFEDEFPYDYHAAAYHAISGITFRVLGVAS